LAAMFEAWISGEPERVTTILQDSPLMLFPDIKRVVFDERNQAWMSKIKAAINQSRRTVIFVGAGHLGGDAGLLALLTRAGHSVTPLLSS